MPFASPPPRPRLASGLLLVVLAGGLSPSLACQAALGGQLVEVGERKLRSDAGLSDPQTITVLGHAVSYVEGGPPEGEVVVLLHGFTGEKANWYTFAPHLVADYRVVALDIPPFGDSPEVPGQAYGVPDHLRHIEGFVDALGLDRFHLIGNSMGGHLAALYALAHPERVRTLALFDAAGVTAPEQSELEKRLAAGENPFVVEDEASFDRFLALATVKPPDVPGPVKAHFVARARERAPLVERLTKSYLETFVRLDDKLADLQTPTLVLWGDSDRIIHPSAADVFHAALPHSQKVVLQECGHVPMMEYPAFTAKVWREFVAAPPGSPVDDGAAGSAEEGAALP